MKVIHHWKEFAAIQCARGEAVGSLDFTPVEEATVRRRFKKLLLSSNH